MRNVFLTGLFIFSAGASAIAATESEIAQATIVRSEIRLLDGLELQAELHKVFTGRSDMTLQSDVVDEISSDFDKIWAIGKKIYPIIKGSEAVLNVNKSTWSVLPRGIMTPSDLASWKGPNYSGYEISYLNAYNMKVVSARYVVSYVHGGKYQNNGSYLAHMTVIPSAIHVQWGFKLDMDVVAKEALNMGPESDPVAGFAFDAQIRVRSVLGNITISNFLDTVHYFMDANGAIKVVD